MLKLEVTYDLNVPFEINDGEKITSIIMKAPGNECRKEAVGLRKSITVAFTEMSERYTFEELKEQAKNEEEVERKPLAPESIIGALYSSNKIDINDCFKSFQDLLITKQLARMSNGDYLSGMAYKSLYLDDVEGMLGVYLANFCLPSQMKRT